MPNTNNNIQIKTLLSEFKQTNKKFKNYLNQVDRKIAELDIKYAQSLVKHDINILKAAKSVLQNKRK